LYYILVKRLLEEKPTILQNDPGVLFLFDAYGVTALRPSSDADPELEAYGDTWALVASPRASRWQDVERYRGSVALWFMKPFTLAELVQASVYLASISSLTYVISQSSTSKYHSQ
jgi:hypothetical protein